MIFCLLIVCWCSSTACPDRPFNPGKHTSGTGLNFLQTLQKIVKHPVFQKRIQDESRRTFGSIETLFKESVSAVLSEQNIRLTHICIILLEPLTPSLGKPLDIFGENYKMPDIAPYMYEIYMTAYKKHFGKEYKKLDITSDRYSRYISYHNCCKDLAGTIFQALEIFKKCIQTGSQIYNLIHDPDTPIGHSNFFVHIANNDSNQLQTIADTAMADITLVDPEVLHTIMIKDGKHLSQQEFVEIYANANAYNEFIQAWRKAHPETHNSSPFDASMLYR